MAAGLDCPSYLSARSADVILSDVRPIRLAPAALRALNVFLDEVLWIVLANARSLSTDRLHGALRKVLPTPLGKEALLEAEVELRAYLEKTPPLTGSPVDEEFALQHAFELLRIKCEAYATLNDRDEDIEAEAKLHAQNAGMPSPKPALLAPAALYLTAILECVCEHVLSIVSRVAARDSSRTSATVQDLFTALCEDTSVFGLFKTMKVYAQIEAMTHESTHQRRKSLSATRDHSPSRNGSPNEPQPPKSSRRPSVTSIKSRLSSDSKRARAGSPALRRSSMEKARAFTDLVSGPARSRSSLDRPAQDPLNPGVENTSAVGGSDRSDPEDDSFDFDEALRSGSTVKVSLTPDRLRSMEAYKQSRRGGSKLASETSSPIAPSDEERTSIATQPGPANRAPPLGARRPSVPSVPQVASIREDDEDLGSPDAASATPLLPSTLSAPTVVPRARNISLDPSASKSVPQDIRKRTMSAAAPLAPRGTDLFVPKPKLVQPPLPQSRAKSDPAPPPSAFPPKRHQVARRRESMDLDDIMNGSDDEEEVEDDEGQGQVAIPPVPSTPRRRPEGSPQTPRTPGVSASTRDLMAFLASGPPEEPQIPSSVSTPGSAKKDKDRGRFSKMVNRLTRAVSQEQLGRRAREVSAAVPPTPPLPAAALGTGAFAGASRVNVNGTTVIAFKPPRPPRPPPAEPMPSVMTDLSSTSASGSMTSLPRSASASAASVPRSASGSSPALPLSPPASPSTQSLVEERARAETPSMSVVQVPTPPQTSSHTRRMSIQRKAVPLWDEEKKLISPNLRPTSSLLLSAPGLHTPEPSVEAPSLQPAISAEKDAIPLVDVVQPSPSEATAVMPIDTGRFGGPVSDSPSPAGESSKSVPIPLAMNTAAKPTVALEDLEDSRRLMARATTADECRLLLDMFLLRSGMALFPSGTEFAVPYPSPVASDGAYMALPSAAIDGEQSPTEASLVELLLGSGDPSGQSLDDDDDDDDEKLLDGHDEDISVPSTPIYKLHIDAHGLDDEDLSFFTIADSSQVMALGPETSAKWTYSIP